MADLITDIKLVLLLIVFIFIVNWTKETTNSKILAVIVGLIITWLVFMHEELAIIAIVIFFAFPYIIKPMLEGAFGEIK